MRYLVDENGEILNEFTENDVVTTLNPNDRILRNTSVEYLKGTVAINIRFFKVSILALQNLNKHASEIWTILPYVDYATGILTHPNGRLVRPKALASKLRKKRRSGAMIIKELCDLDVLHKHKDGRTYFYTFNPYIAIRSKRITKELYDEFKDTIYRDKEWEYK